MTAAVSPNTAVPSGIGEFPCEGAKTIKVRLDFGAEPAYAVDLTTIQAQGGWTAAQTIFIDNRGNDDPVFVECNASFQTFACPPQGYLYMPVLATNPPVFNFSSAGGTVVPVHFINFFLPPIVWSPDAPPGGGGSGGITQVEPTDFSGASPVVIPANAAHKWLIISNPQANAALMTVDIGGASIEIPIGGAYETGPAVPMGAITITVGGAGVVVAAEGE